MKIKLIITLLLISNILFAQKTTEIKGQIKNNTGFESIYLANLATGAIIDSSEISKDGNYSFSMKIDKANFYKFILDQNNFVMYIPEIGEKAEINFDINDLFSPEIKNSKHTSLIYKGLAGNNTVDEKLEVYKQKLEEEKKDLIRNMIKNNPNSLACVFFIDQLNIEEDAESYKKLSEGLKDYSEIQWVGEIISQTEKASFLAIGSEAPEIELASPEGKMIKLSSLRGNYVLIDFWASWCRPCRAESPNMVKYYNEFHKKGFEIYSVSFDKEKDAWVNAIKNDNLNWTHVSDLKFWQSAAGQTYGVNSIPYTVLIDKKGKIIAKNLRGDELEKKLKEIFN